MTHKKRRFPAAVLALFLVLEFWLAALGEQLTPTSTLPSQTETESPETLPDISSERLKRPRVP